MSEPLWTAADQQTSLWIKHAGRIVLGTQAEWESYPEQVYLGSRYSEDERPAGSVTFAERRAEQARPIPNRTVTVNYMFGETGQVKRRDHAFDSGTLILDTTVIADRTFVVLTTGELIALDCVDKITIDPVPDDAAE